MRERQVNYWPSLADMILSIMLLMLILGLVQKVFMTAEATQKSKTDRMDDDARSRLMEENHRLKIENETLETRVRDLTVEITRLSDQYRRDKPPIITLDEASGYNFQSGSAELSENFGRAIDEEIVQKLCSIFLEYGVDVVEVIGHTDGQPIGGAGNLDYFLEQAAAGQTQLTTLAAGSNADLGLIRAVAVARRLRETGRLPEATMVRAYSAAQLLLPDGSLSPTVRHDDPARRRIELRFTKLTQ